MPNWVYNEMTIPVQSAEEADRIVETLRAQRQEEPGPLSFERLIPRPAEEEDWYHWQISNWGTKWDACDATVERRPTALIYNFNTAWSPPMPFFAALAKMFPDRKLRFVYEEEQGWGAVVEGTGELSIVKEWDIPSSHADYIERGRECFCDDTPVFADCFYERAKANGITDPKTLEAIKALGAEWSDSFERLLDVVPKL